MGTFRRPWKDGEEMGIEDVWETLGPMLVRLALATETTGGLWMGSGRI